MRDMRLYLLVYFLLTSLWASPALGLDFPSLFESPEVLPTGQSTFSLALIHSPLESQINGASRGSRASETLLREVTWGELIQSLPQSEQTAFRELQKKNGRTDDDVIAREHVKARGFRVALKPFWAFGLGDRWTVGARVPVVMESREVVRRTEWVDSPSSASFTTLNSQMKAGMKQLGSQPLAIASSIDGFESGWRYHIGDVEIVGQYLLSKQANWAWSIRHKLVLPTSPPPDPYNLDPVLASEGQTDLGADSMWEWNIGTGWSLSVSAGYLVQLADRVAMRIPDRRRAFLQGQIDRDVVRNPGDVATAELLMRYALPGAWRIKAGYLHSEKFADHYAGNEYTPGRYEYLAENTDQSVGVGRLGISYVSAPVSTHWFRRLRLMSAHVEMYSVVDGNERNSDPITELGLSFAY